MSSKPKKKTAEQRELEIQSAVMFGKHVSKEKGRLLLVATLLACAMPMLIGVRMWENIPEIVESGLITADGKDDSIPRWMVVFGLPGLMCILDLIAHMQLLWHQKRMTLPAAHIRLMGRWGFPILSVIFCTGMVFQSMGQTPLQLAVVTPSVLGLVLMMLGAHVFDCPKDSQISLRFSFTMKSEQSWNAVHRFAGWCWLAAGLVIIAAVMLIDGAGLICIGIFAAALIAPVIYGYARFSAL